LAVNPWAFIDETVFEQENCQAAILYPSSAHRIEFDPHENKPSSPVCYGELLSFLLVGNMVPLFMGLRREISRTSVAEPLGEWDL
jgi:hypothetical protein